MDQVALQAHLRRLEQTMAGAPQHVLDQLRHAQQIDAHNKAVDEAKAKRKHFKAMAKQARIPVDVLKRMVSSVKRVK